LPITLTLKLGTNEVDYPQQTTDPSGFFTVSLGTLPAGTYNWRVKSAQAGSTPTSYNPGFLSTAGTIPLSGAPITNVEMGLQLAGDCDNNDVVSASDFTILKATFGKASGQPGYDNRADFDGNQAITASDFTQLKANFGHSGAPPLRGITSASGELQNYELRITN
jgi:hypothetical protein